MKNFTKLDNTDRKILYYLDANSRMSNLQIARKMRSSREVVDYRIKRLINKGIIKRFYTHIHSEKLGYTAFKLYLKLKGLAEDKERELKEYFYHNEYVYWIATCDGVYDLIVSIWAKDVYDLNQILRTCFHKYGEYFLSKDITVTICSFQFRKEYLLNKEKKEIPSIDCCGDRERYSLDDKDTEILKLLCNNARMPVIEIAKKVKLTSGAVIRRIKSLEQKNIIAGYRCSIYLEKLDHTFAKAFLSFNYVDEKKEKELFQFCRQNPNITLYLACFGHWDFEIEFETENKQVFHDLLKEIKKRFSDIIKDCESVIISSEYKFSTFHGAYSDKIEKS